MGFREITTVHFRNLESGRIGLGNKNIILVGPNGQGKTNFLEAVYYLCFASSFRTPREKHLVRTGETEFAVSGRFETPDEGLTEISIQHREKRKIVLDGKALASRSFLAGTIPCIVFCHGDIDFVGGSPERKRQFADQSLSFFDPDYLQCLINYRKLLKMRAVLLKERKFQQADVIEIQMARIGLDIARKRRAFLDDFSPGFSRAFSSVSDMDQDVSLRYGASWKSDDENEIIGQLCASRETDLKMGFATTGPHRDRIEFYAGKKPFSQIASTGQLRLASLTLRSAQAAYVRQKTRRDPVLLVDDVLLELDPEKKRKFLSAMDHYDQAFFTFLPEEKGMGFIRDEALVYTVSGGALTDAGH